MSVGLRFGAGCPFEDIGPGAGVLESKVDGGVGRTCLSTFGIVSGKDTGGRVSTDFENVDAFRSFGIADAEDCG